jgi:hypothetical protein
MSFSEAKLNITVPIVETGVCPDWKAKGRCRHGKNGLGCLYGTHAVALSARMRSKGFTADNGSETIL